MKTTLEIQQNGLDLKASNIEKYVKETIKEKGIKTTDTKDLEIYYTPSSNTIYYVARLADETEVKGNLVASDVPKYPAPVKKPVVKKTPAKKEKKTTKKK